VLFHGCLRLCACSISLCIGIRHSRKKERKKRRLFPQVYEGERPLRFKKKNGFCALKTKHFHVQNQVVKLVRVEMLTQIL